MSTKQKRVFWPSVIISALGLSVLAFASVRKAPRSGAFEVRSAGRDSASASGENYVRRRFLRPQLVQNLKAMGNRLEKPGKERLTITGTLSYAADPQPGHVVVILEFPDKLRLTIEQW